MSVEIVAVEDEVAKYDIVHERFDQLAEAC